MHLVTGGLGFIGNELVRQLLAAGQDVAIIDNRNRVAPDIDDIADVPVHEVDIADRSKLLALFADMRPETVYHLAAIHFIPECNANPARTLRVNVEGTQNVLDAAAAAGTGHLLFASSGAVYADSPAPLAEDAPVDPVDIYGLSKMFGEALCRRMVSKDGLRITACRFFNNIGPRETNAHIVPEIISQLRESDTLRLGNIDPVRDYITTSDTAAALKRLTPLLPDPYRVVNVATGTGASVRQLIDIIGGILGRELVVETDPARFRKADKAVQVADTTALQQLLGWVPNADLRTGIATILGSEGLL